MSDAINDAIEFHRGRLTAVEGQIAELTDKTADVGDVTTIDTRTQVSGARGQDRLAQLNAERMYHRDRLNALAIPREQGMAHGTDEVGNILDETLVDVEA
jgi:hypothetical protein